MSTRRKLMKLTTYQGDQEVWVDHQQAGKTAETAGLIFIVDQTGKHFFINPSNIALIEDAEPDSHTRHLIKSRDDQKRINS